MNCVDFIGPRKHKIIIAQMVVQKMERQKKQSGYEHKDDCKCFRCFVISFLNNTVFMYKDKNWNKGGD